METKTDSPDGRTASGVIASVLILALAIALLGVGIVFSNSFGAKQVASNARALHWTNATLGSTGIARAAVAQSVFFAFDERLGVTADDSKQAAIAEARVSLGPVVALLTSPDLPPDSDLAGQVGEFLELSTSVVDEAETGSPNAAEGLRLDELEPLYLDLRDALRSEQTRLAGLITETETSAGRLARLTQLAITFLIPGLTLAAFWWILRRRMREREDELQIRLTAERRLTSAKDDFIAGLSHELRTPLTTIHGFSELLMERDLDPESKEMAAIINDGSADLSRMVSDLLVAARIDAEALSWSPESLDLDKEVMTALAPYTKSGRRIEVSALPDLRVFADAVHFRQIVRNLVSNAQRHGGERVVISACTIGDDNVALAVADDGQGVPAETEDLLFQRFVHRGKQAMVAGSVGLGLAVSRELANRMGGTISYSRDDGWTTFTLVLPQDGPGPGLDEDRVLEPEMASS